MSRELSVYLLGLPRVEHEGQPIELKRRKATALLAYLVVTGRPHSRDALASLHAIGRLMDGYGSDACDRDDVNRLGRLVREIADKGMGHWRVLEDARLKHSTVA